MSPVPMLGRARERQQEQQLQNLSFLPADAQTHQFEPASVDLIFSRFGVMFFEDAAQAFEQSADRAPPWGATVFPVLAGVAEERLGSGAASGRGSTRAASASSRARHPRPLFFGRPEPRPHDS